jgi:hypothetical protein
LGIAQRLTSLPSSSLPFCTSGAGGRFYSRETALQEREMQNIFGAVAVFGVIILAFAGWVLNIVAIVGSVDAAITGMFILRCIGIFVAPLGAVLGYV